MKKFMLFLYVIFITSTLQAQSSTDLDNSLDTIWDQSNNFKVQVPLNPPIPPRKTIPGDSVIQIPIEQSKGPLNASPNDVRAYVLYNRATIAFQNNKHEQARSLYRELIRRYPDSSYTSFSLYVLSLSETDYRRKIRILLTILERFPDFPYRHLIIDSLGELYYLIGSVDAAEEVLKNSHSYNGLYTRALIAMDKQKPNRAISLIRKAIKVAPNNEVAYKIYILYAEALILLKSYRNALTILEKTSTLRPWAYDNGIAILLNAGKSFFNNSQYPQALYTFSLLRLRFSRSTESRLADQYIDALYKKGTVEMLPVSWIDKNFETLIQERPITSLKTPTSPSLADIQQMNNLPPTGIPEPQMDDIAIVTPMPMPVPARNKYDVLVPVNHLSPTVDLITITNSVLQTITNTVEKLLTNRIFVVETNTFSNNFTQINQKFLTNETFKTNIVQVVETNNVISYEPIVIWNTNYRHIDITNLVTNIVDVVVTNERIELLPLQKTNYNFVNRNKNITNVIVRTITNRYLEYGLDNKTNWKENIVKKRFIEVIPAWKTTYQTIDTNSLVTNVIIDVVTNTRLELVPNWVSNLRTNNSYRMANKIITNRRLRIAPRWITNFQVIQTNMRDVVLTNVVNIVKTNFKDVVLTNVRSLIYTNMRDVVITNIQNIIHTNVQDVVVTNVQNVIQTNLRDFVITNVQNVIRTNTRETVVTNVRNLIYTNMHDIVVTNVRNIIHTNIQDVVVTNVRNMIHTNVQDVIVTNVQNVIQTNLRDVIITNVQNKIYTNLKDMIITNIQNVIQTNTRETVITNTLLPNITNIITNTSQVITTNFLDNNTADTAQIQFAPTEFELNNNNLDAQIDKEEQSAFLTEPIYTMPIEEEQIKFVSQEITQLEKLASQLAEKSAGIVGDYGFSNNKGFVIRIAELKDLSVANIVLRDISKLDLGVPVGVYYRHNLYYIEMRALKDKKLAEKIYQQLYQLGYTDVQLFEQYEVTEYQE